MADDPGTPTIFGWDASDYDWARGPMDLAAARADGIDWFTHKATEATGTRHTHYGEAMRRARDAGIPVLGAYHVVRSPRNAAAEVDFHLSYVDSETPWWRDFPSWFWQVDLEVWPYDSVPAVEGEDFADLIEARTGRKAILYASRGQYGNQLVGTSHELWNADYGSNPTVHYRDAYAASGGDGGRGWTSYSGRTPLILQFGARTTIGRQNICDANAFRGTLAQLTDNLKGTVTDMGLNFNQHAILSAIANLSPTMRLDTSVAQDGTGPQQDFPVALTAAIQVMKAADAADATRDAGVLAAVAALANAGGVDAAPIVAAIKSEAAATRALVEEQHQAEMDELRQAMAALKRDSDAEVAGLRAELAELTKA